MATALRLGMVATALAFSAIGLAACDEVTPTDEQTTDQQEPPSEDELSETDAREMIAHLLGVNEDRAEELADENEWTMRIGRRGDETFALTEDYVIGRITIELDTEDDGQTWRVTSATVEATDGPVTDELQPS